ncbi:MAG: PQQ-dependent sugar dehydrogenase [Pelobium sp.]
MKHLSILFFIIMALSCKKAKENTSVNTDPVKLKTTEIATGLSNPWEILEGPNNELWFTEKGGKISRINLETKQVNTIFTVPDVASNGEGGLLGMVLHPDFTTSQFVYLVYNYNSSNGYKEKVVRYNYSNGSLNTPKILLQDIPANSFHNGSRLMIYADKLFITTGDAGNANNAQDKNSISGKVLRMNLDGTIPSDNPFPNSYVYSFGHRNAQGLVMVDDKIYSSEHGPNNDDEINIIQKGRNFGWPNVEGFCDKSAESNFCTANNVVEPLMVWTPTIAPSGMVYYNADLIPQWKNSLLLAVLKGSKVLQLKLKADKTGIDTATDFLVNDFGRIRDLAVAKDGKVYFCTSNGNNDKIVMVSPE